MKKTLLLAFVLTGTSVIAQQHFAGMSTSRRVSFLNAGINPAELANLTTKYELNVFGVSAGIANNKITFGDIVSGENFSDLVFSGTQPTNLRTDIELLGPSFAVKYRSWAFGVSTTAKVRADMIDLNPALANAVTNGGIDNVTEVYDIIDNFNQRGVATSWGEIGINVAKTLLETDKQKLSVGVNLKLLFPGSYANIGAGNLDGIVINNNNDVALTNATASLNFAYSGSLANGFDDSSNYTKFFAGGLNGFGADIGVNYQLKSSTDPGRYFINAGLSLKNIGSLTFKDDNNRENNYNLNIPANQSLNLNQFENVDNIQEVEDILLQSGFVTLTQTNRDFKINLPTYIAAYADVNFVSNFYAALYIQQKFNEDNNNNQIAVQNMITLIPRFSLSNFEVFVPMSVNEISDFTAGFGLRAGFFYLGSGSILSAAIADTHQADAYLGFRFGF
ncbi:hypothetical protein AM493_02170 [Flavobacterium akiainvivens]|uniref:DUF5723 domain-containing protein n=1 Tax=Flavobacterium akiainvivens TaxID=1202724 RepID=A0A0M8MG02_9FLAO|nr:hypothetical protein [Flavobacterium akiainvivens]KOS04977.1 hypothetical protein AM493_02170 [Flavobacterium akiainvivens]SFQ41115.1 hypothetical protein SAMN05444144_10485 [Flavobacterium akiainvivens]